MREVICNDDVEVYRSFSDFFSLDGMPDRSSLSDFYYIRFTAVEIVACNPFTDPIHEPLPVSFAGKIVAEFFTDLDGIDFIHKAGVFLGRICQVLFFIPKGFGLDFPLASIHVDLFCLNSVPFYPCGSEVFSPSTSSLSSLPFSSQGFFEKIPL
ncbi:hypothetical protein [Syntrophotalea acetylenica]|uniref:hypothetical protein n=1 Tax=Syntrophotalea acetylenica TaxID=29542 RepID=UPI0011AB6A64|nr:hypothetical protein [Syntrophotalea acetylenica]